MTRSRIAPVVAGCALLMSTAPLILLFHGFLEWFGPILVAVACVVGAGHCLRILHRGGLVQTVGMVAALGVAVTLMFRSGSEPLGFVPTGATLTHFRTLAGQAGTQVAAEAIPVHASDGMVFVLVLCLGILAILTDQLVATFSSPALVGIPMFVLYVTVVAISPDGVPWVLFLPGAVGYLWLLLTDNVERVRRFGRRFSGDGRGIEQWESSPLATTGRWLALIAIPLALIVPSLLPGMTSGLIDHFYNAGASPGGTGTGPGTAPNRVDPVAAMQGALDAGATTELGVVSTDNPDPGYMKMWAASTLTEQGFHAEVAPSPEAVAVQDGFTTPYVSPEVSGTEWTATFNVVEMADYALPLYGVPNGVEVDGDWLYDPRTNTVSSSSHSTQNRSFTYTYVDYDYTADLLRTAEPTPRGSRIHQDNTPVPDNPYVADLVADLTADHDNQYDKVMAVHDHFSRANGFGYELSTETGWSGSAIIDFLENKEGFCQQYAGAMAWMVRQADIPARVAIGLTRGNIVGDGYRVTNFNFHAWVEVYFHGFGWVPFDPTPSANIRTPTDYDWAPDPDRSDASDPGTNPNDPGEQPDPQTGADPQDPTAGGGPSDSAVVLSPHSTPANFWWVPAVGAAVVAAFLLTPAAARVLRRHRRLSVPNSRPLAAADAAWREFTETTADLGLSIDPAHSPRTVAERLDDLGILSDWGLAGVRHLAAAEERARYAAHPPTGMTLAVAYRAARNDMYRSVSLMAQLRADLYPPTLLRQWRQAVSRHLGQGRRMVGRVGMVFNRGRRGRTSVTR